MFKKSDSFTFWLNGQTRMHAQLCMHHCEQLVLDHAGSRGIYLSKYVVQDLAAPIILIGCMLVLCHCKKWQALHTRDCEAFIQETIVHLIEESAPFLVEGIEFISAAVSAQPGKFRSSAIYQMTDQVVRGAQ